MTLHVQTMYGWGWRDSSGRVAEVAPAFYLEADLTVHNDFRVAVGHVSQSKHPFSGKWVAVSPFPVVEEWGYCHLCVFAERPPILTDLETLMELAQLTGFADVNPSSN